ncbi:MAG: ATP synthase F1 subunit delta [Armatimonadota bacterium]
MISESVARRYVKAVFGVASDSGQAEALAPLLQELEELFRGHDDLRAVLSNPRLPDARKQSLLLRLLGEDAPDLLQRFLTLLVDKRRIDVLRYAGSLYHELLDEAAGVRHARVVTALPLGAQQEQALVDVLSRQLDCTITVESRVDPEVIGGVSVRVGDLLIDGTLRRRLEELRVKVTGARA